MATYAKPYLTPDQQVALLQSRGMEISDIPKAKSCLARIGYYRLSAYWYPFRQSQQYVDQTTGQPTVRVLDNYRPDTDFPTILNLYVFDKKLRILVLDALERVEIATHTDIALLIGARGPLAHRDPAELHGNFARRPSFSGAQTTKHADFIGRLDRKFQDSREDFVKHFKLKYPNNHLPIWMAVELWDFGNLAHFFNGMKIQDTQAISKQYRINDFSTLGSWLRCLNDVRNICAHHSRLWNRALVASPTWPMAGKIPELDHVSGSVHSRTRLYAALVILRWMLKVVNPTSSWAIRLIDHTKTFPVNPHISLENSGFPLAWDKLPLWR